MVDKVVEFADRYSPIIREQKKHIQYPEDIRDKVVVVDREVEEKGKGDVSGEDK